MISKEWQRAERAVEELNLNWDLWKDLGEVQELLMYLAHWLISFKHYSPVSSEEENEIYVRGLANRLEGYVSLLSRFEPKWQKLPENREASSTSEVLQGLSELTDKVLQENPDLSLEN